MTLAPYTICGVHTVTSLSIHKAIERRENVVTLSLSDLTITPSSHDQG